MHGRTCIFWANLTPFLRQFPASRFDARDNRRFNSSAEWLGFVSSEPGASHCYALKPNSPLLVGGAFKLPLEEVGTAAWRKLWPCKSDDPAGVPPAILGCTVGALGAGSYLHVANQTLAQAVQWCEADHSCGGFTTRSTTCDSGGDSSVHKVYFKAELGGNSDKAWRTWAKPNWQPLVFACVAGQCTPCPAGGDPCAPVTYLDSACFGQCGTDHMKEVPEEVLPAVPLVLPPKHPPGRPAENSPGFSIGTLVEPGRIFVTDVMKAVGIVACSPNDPLQLWEPLSDAGVGSAPQPIRHHGGACISAQPCADRASNCALGLVACNATDPFQLFSFNASTGVVRVPPAAAGPRVSPSKPQCWNVWGNRRTPGFAVDVCPCGPPPIPTGPDAVLLRQDAQTGVIHVRGTPSVCLSLISPPPTPPSPPAPNPERPNITRHGTWDLGMVETTPINVKGKLWLYVDSAEQPCGPQGCFAPCSAGIAPCVPGKPVTKPCCSLAQKNNLRFIDVLSGDTVGAPFGGGEGLGSALYVEATDTVYVYATICGKIICEVNVYSSKSSDMKTWKKSTAITTAQAQKVIKSTLWNTSVDKGKVNSTDMYVMAFETDLSYWTTRFAVSEKPEGPWRVLDVAKYWIVSPTLETADPTIRYNAKDGYWYCMTGRKSPTAWFFFMEIFRAKEITGPWTAAPGQGNGSSVGTPMLAPITPADVAADKALLSPAAWHGGERSQFLIAMSPWWMTADDVNDSDLDLVEYDNKDPALGPLGPTVVMYYCWCAEPATTNSARAPHPHRALCEHSARLAVEGSHAAVCTARRGSQHSNNGLGLATAPGTLNDFLSAWFPQDATGADPSKALHTSMYTTE
jgi:hypothetical protein